LFFCKLKKEVKKMNTAHILKKYKKQVERCLENRKNFVKQYIFENTDGGLSVEEFLKISSGEDYPDYFCEVWENANDIAEIKFPYPQMKLTD
jgi:hypothetical protein